MAVDRIADKYAYKERRTTVGGKTRSNRPMIGRFEFRHGESVRREYLYSDDNRRRITNETLVKPAAGGCVIVDRRVASRRNFNGRTYTVVYIRRERRVIIDAGAKRAAVYMRTHSSEDICLRGARITIIYIYIYTYDTEKVYYLFSCIACTFRTIIYRVFTKKYKKKKTFRGYGKS